MDKTEPVKNEVSVPTNTTSLSLSVGQSFGGFRVKQVLTIPRYLMKEGTPVLLSPLGTFKVGVTAAKEGDAGATLIGKRWQKEIDLLPCQLFTSDGASHTNVDVIAPAVFKNELEEKFPKGAYVGKKFAVRVFAQMDANGKAKRAKGVSLFELE